MKKFFYLLSLFCLGLTQPAEAKIKLHSIGDSTMQTYDESTDKRGWGQMLQQFFNVDQIQVNNRGKSGASSKSFYLESAYWPTMVAQKSSSTTIEAGDYVIIQFAHNDEIFCKDDSTHPIALGATLIARAFAQAVKNGDNQIVKANNYVEANKAKSDAVLAALAESVVVSNEITFNPTTGDLGRAFAGQQLVKQFNISAFGLPQATGSITLTTDGIFQLSADKQQWGQELTLTYTGSTLISSVYVCANLAGAGTVSGTLTASDGIHVKSLSLTAEVVSLASESVECSVLWPMDGNGDPVVTGPIQAQDETWSEMYVRDNNNINKAAVWPDESGYDASRKTQRNCIEGDAWPAGEIDEVSTRYIQFAVQCPAEMQLDLDRISLYVAGAGGSGMRCKVYYSLDPLFSAPTQIAEYAAMAGNTAYQVNADLAETLSAGQQLYLRIYPWYSGGCHR